MLKPLEVFENEEAEKLLDYYWAYRKLSSTADHFKCLATVNREISYRDQVSKPESVSEVGKKDGPVPRSKRNGEC